MPFSQEQKTFMLESYFRNGRKIDGVWQYNIPDCCEEFRNEFPEIVFQYDQFRSTLHKCVALFRETGSIGRKQGSGRPKIRTNDAVENVRNLVEEAPRTSIRVLAQQTEMSYGTCQTILKKDLHLHAYRLTSVHELLPVDPPQRVEYCQWFINTINNDDTLNNVFYSDEAWFHLSGYVNSQNMRMWSAENPHFFTEAPLHPQKIGVWAGFSRRRIIGPYFFEGNLNAQRYREEILTPFINELHDDELENGYFQQDGATAHCTQQNLEMLGEFFGERIISRNGPVNYPPRSCDLTPCDFFLWPYLKNSIFKQRIENLEQLRQRITEKIQEINNTPALLENVFNGMKRRVTKCFEADGEHFQHLL